MTDNTHGPTHKRTMTTNKKTELPPFPKAKYRRFQKEAEYILFFQEVQQWRGTMTQQIQADIDVMTDEYFAEQKVRDIKVDLDEARKKNSNFVDGFICGFQEGYLYKAKQVLGALDP